MRNMRRDGHEKMGGVRGGEGAPVYVCGGGGGRGSKACQYYVAAPSHLTLCFNEPRTYVVADHMLPC